MLHIANTVESGATVYTDGSHVYRGLEGYEHEAVIHSRGEYVRGDCYTNGIEAFWSMIPRSSPIARHALSRFPVRAHCPANCTASTGALKGHDFSGVWLPINAPRSSRKLASMSFEKCGAIEGHDGSFLAGCGGKLGDQFLPGRSRREWPVISL